MRLISKIYLCSGFYQNPLMGVLAIFSTGTYAIIGTMCVESETCYEKYHEKKKILSGRVVVKNEFEVFIEKFQAHDPSSQQLP